MIEAEVDIKTRDGEMNAFVTHPEEGGPFPAVFFYMDAPGKREELHDMARRIATVGYYVVLPNLYYRTVREFALLNRDEAGMKRMFELMSSLTNTKVVEDTEALLGFVDRQPQVRRGKVGAVGLLHERPLRLRGRRAVPGASRRRGVDLRRAPDQRRPRLRAPAVSPRSRARSTSRAPRSTAGRPRSRSTSSSAS